MILRRRLYATYWISVDRNRKLSDTENIRQCSWSHKILTLILLSGVLIFFYKFLRCFYSVVLSLPFYYYLCILDVTIRLPSMLVWAWYVLRTDCTTVLSPVYWHNFSKQAVREAAQYAPAPVRRTLQPRSTHTSLSSLMMWKLQLSNNSFEWKNLTFYGVKTYSDPPTYFQGI